MHEQEGMIQLSYSAKCPYLDILLRQITESYLPAHASPSKLAWSRCKLYGAQLHVSLDIDDKLVQSTVFLCVVCCVWLRGLSYIMCFSFSSSNNAWHRHNLKTLTGQAQLEDTSRYTATTQHRIRAVQTTSKDISFWRDCSALVTFCL